MNVEPTTLDLMRGLDAAHERDMQVNEGPERGPRERWRRIARAAHIIVTALGYAVIFAGIGFALGRLMGGKL